MRRVSRGRPASGGGDEVRRWRALAGTAVGLTGTPAFVFSAEDLGRGLAELEAAFAGIPVRHWWSFKTLPLGPAVTWWMRRGGPVEVVSDFELRAALRLGVSPENLLVNGPAKHAWLPAHRVRGLRVNFDSLSEIRALSGQARDLGWSVGLRVSTAAEENFEHPGIRAPFGLLAAELPAAARGLRRSGLACEVLHFHLRTNVSEARMYGEAAEEALGAAAAAGVRPRVLDLGGGFPARSVRARGGGPLDAGFSLASMRRVLEGVRARHRFLEGFWMENGRWLAAPAGVLMVRVLDVKEGRGARTLVCDGGRTLQALVATWERHRLIPRVSRRGALVRTIVHGPTCMAFDNLGVHELPGTIREGDVLLWMDAGAYQLAWESRFSHGLAGVAWAEGGGVRCVREREGFEAWFGVQGVCP